MMTTRNLAAASLATIFVTTLAVSASTPASSPAPAAEVSVARGEYLVNAVGGCHDCHTPFKLGPNGPEPDMARALTGHPESLVMPPVPKLPPGPWIAVAAATNTAHAGPWGVSFTANLTPDKETGLGEWTADQFVATIRTGRHLGKGRPILPPMPYPVYGKMTDDDLRSIFAYLQSLKPVRNKVPQPIDPEDGGR